MSDATTALRMAQGDLRKSIKKAEGHGCQDWKSTAAMRDALAAIDSMLAALSAQAEPTDAHTRETYNRWAIDNGHPKLPQAEPREPGSRRPLADAVAEWRAEPAKSAAMDAAKPGVRDAMRCEPATSAPTEAELSALNPVSRARVLEQHAKDVRAAATMAEVERLVEAIDEAVRAIADPRTSAKNGHLIACASLVDQLAALASQPNCRLRIGRCVRRAYPLPCEDSGMTDRYEALRKALDDAAHLTEHDWHWHTDAQKGDPLGRSRAEVTTLGRTITRTHYSGTDAEKEAALICAAVNAAHALLAERDAARADAESWQQQMARDLDKLLAVAAERNALEKERDGLRSARIAYASEFAPNAEGEPDIGSIHANIRALKAERDALKEDAERYRALRESRGGVVSWDMPTVHPPFHPEQYYTPEGLDAAIDAAMQATKESSHD